VRSLVKFLRALPRLAEGRESDDYLVCPVRTLRQRQGPEGQLPPQIERKPTSEIRCPRSIAGAKDQLGEAGLGGVRNGVTTPDRLVCLAVASRTA
jgi:hypothetical protein